MLKISSIQPMVNIHTTTEIVSILMLLLFCSKSLKYALNIQSTSQLGLAILCMPSTTDVQGRALPHLWNPVVDWRPWWREAVNIWESVTTSSQSQVRTTLSTNPAVKMMFNRKESTPIAQHHLTEQFLASPKAESLRLAPPE